MVSSSSSSSHSLSSPPRPIGGQAQPPSPKSSSDEKAARALEALMWPHDLDSTVSESSLGYLRGRYGIPEDFTLIAPEPGQRAYDPIPKGFALTLDALEAGLRLPLHPVISSCVLWWRVSPSQIAPNSWRYLVAFLGECHYASINPTRSLFLSCFRLSKSSICDLCCLPVGAPDEIYQARAVGGLSEGQPSGPLVARWEGLARGDRVWANGEAAATFSRGRLLPDIARELYVLPSDVLLSRSNKSLLWGHHYATALTDRVRDAGRALGVLIDRNIELRRQIEEVRAGAAPEAVAATEQRASNLEAEVTRLKSEVSVAVQRASDSEAEGTRLQARVKAAEEQNKDLQTLLRTTQTEVRLANKEAVSLAQKLEEARGEARRASEALAVETQQRPEKDKKLIEDYKESSGFQLGLVRSGQVTYEHGYRIALTRFKVCHPGLEVEENPFGSHPEDASVDMPEDVPFDDSLEAPKE
ncbi:hypothetical protein C4D60_Mb10t13350 [Musa balbisiana]|uniref:Transposase (putative) gypsy type domain-containing protein n=1 Tax=Musa balbisiana TaxID=52838 RepID=A0A4S8IWT5_MUSBA|nr:hypothetical protein C4D60_Mb10t13350 [Musa balbisiana]